MEEFRPPSPCLLSLIAYWLLKRLNWTLFFSQKVTIMQMQDLQNYQFGSKFIWTFVFLLRNMHLTLNFICPEIIIVSSESTVSS